MKKFAGVCAAHVDFPMRRPSHPCRLGIARSRWRRFPRIAITTRRHPMPDSRYRWVIVAAGGLMAASRSARCFAAGVPARDRARHGLVDDRHFRRDDARLHRDGLREHGMGQPVGPHRHAPGPRCFRCRCSCARSRATRWSMTGISGAMTLGFIAMAFASMAWGSLSDRIGTRPVVITGAVLLSASLALASRAPSCSRSSSRSASPWGWRRDDGRWRTRADGVGAGATGARRCC